MKNFETLINEFANCVVSQNEAIRNTNSALGNRYASRYIKAFEKLRSYGDAGREALSILLDDKRADVRVMAAAYLLRYNEKKARIVLEAEAKGKGLIAFGASQALRRWDDGTWNLDPISEKTNEFIDEPRLRK